MHITTLKYFCALQFPSLLSSSLFRFLPLFIERKLQKLSAAWEFDQDTTFKGRGKKRHD